ncbi:MAG: hypothetical protein AAFW81_09505 [Pseudomonadota bacterium]
MTRQQQGDFAYGFERENDSAIAFRCSDDANEWPWLKLHPANQIALQATNYFALTGVSRFAGALDGTKWSALTAFRWRAHDLGEGAAHPARGLSHNADDEVGYSCRFFAADGAPVYDVEGAGVVFRTRDFEAWRAKAKAEILASPAPEGFVFAAPGDVGVDTAAEVFVAPPAHDDDGAYVDALVTEESGFRPNHPYHGGSGDHVNSSHLCDAVQQAVKALRGRGFPRGGSARFSRYVELARPFRLALAGEARDRLDLQITQAGHKCATIAFDYDDD